MCTVQPGNEIDHRDGESTDTPVKVRRNSSTSDSHQPGSLINPFNKTGISVTDLAINLLVQRINNPDKDTTLDKVWQDPSAESY